MKSQRKWGTATIGSALVAAAVTLVLGALAGGGGPAAAAAADGHIETAAGGHNAGGAGDSDTVLNWTEQTPATSPPSRFGATMAYDPATGDVVLFGGQATRGSVQFGDTWLWNGTNWVKQHPADSPPARVGASLAYDPATSNVVLFGGMRGDAELLDTSATWAWDGTNWIKQHPAHLPPARYAASMAYDAATHDMVMFGGADTSGGLFHDTWVWNGTTWAKQAPATHPPNAAGGSMAYDAATGNVVLFGGSGNAEPLSGATWTWNGITWAKQAPPAHPPARYAASMAYDAATSNVVLFGGTDSHNGVLHGTWTWDGTTWAKQAPATHPPSRPIAAMAYDVATGNVVLFIGGVPGAIHAHGETWIWGPSG